MKQLVVIGDPVEHSLSPVMHNAALKELGLDSKFVFKPERVPKEKLPAFIDRVREREFEGCSVTLPLKESILSHVENLTPEADLIRAVNTLYFENSTLVGHNTDGHGCLSSLKEHKVSLENARIILLGAGGAARAIAFTLAREPIAELTILNRTPEKAESLALELLESTVKNIHGSSLNALEIAIKNATLLINATSVGMHGPLKGSMVIPANILHSGVTVMDAVYTPIQTPLLKGAKDAGCQTIPGIEMLVHQGAAQFKLFTGKEAPVEVMRQAALEALQ